MATSTPARPARLTRGKLRMGTTCRSHTATIGPAPFPDSHENMHNPRGQNRFPARACEVHATHGSGYPGPQALSTPAHQMRSPRIAGDYPASCAGFPSPMRPLRYAARFFVMALVIGWFVAVYALGRMRALFAGDAEKRRRAVARLRGRVLRQAMTALGATFVKLGQVMSTRPDLLEPETIDELRALQDRLPAFPIARVRRTLEEDLDGPV